MFDQIRDRDPYVRMIFAPEFTFFAETISTEGHGQVEGGSQLVII